MTWVMLAMRRSQLMERVSALQAQTIDIQNRINQLADYATNIADGVITSAEASSCPVSMFQTQGVFMESSVPIAYNMATMKTDMYIAQQQQAMTATGGQYGLANGGMGDPYLIFNEMFKKELEEYANEMKKQIDQEERALQQEKTRIDVQLRTAEAELQTYSESINKNIQNDAIKLT